MPLDLKSLKTGQRVRYRVATEMRKDPQLGYVPAWSEWAESTITVFRRTTDLPVQMRGRSNEWRKGQIIVLHIDGRDDIAEFSESDYCPEYNQWQCEEYGAEFEPIPETAA